MKNIILKFKSIFKWIFKRNIKINKTVYCEACWYGNSYGGFYVNSNLLSKESIVYSFGIGEDISFDTDIIDKHDCKVFGFDPTPKSIEWIKNQTINSNFKFFGYGIGNKTEMKTFFLPKNNRHVSGSIVSNANTSRFHHIEVLMKSFLDIHQELNHNSIDVLKMDIEGSEYEVIPDLLRSGVQIKQILIEFHHRFVENGETKTLNAIKLLNSYGFEVFAISNSFEEISFINKNLL